MSDKKTMIISYGLLYIAIGLSINNSFLSLIFLLVATTLLLKFRNRHKQVNIIAVLLLSLANILVYISGLKETSYIGINYLIITGLSVIYCSLFLTSYYQLNKTARKKTALITSLIFVGLISLMAISDVAIKLLMHSSEYGVLTGFWKMALMFGFLNLTMWLFPNRPAKQLSFKKVLSN